MLRVFQSGSARERILRAQQFMSELPAGKEAVVVAASRAAADDFVRSLAATYPATFGLHRFSLMHFAVQIARGDLAQSGFAPLTATGADAIALRAAFEVRMRGELKFFEGVANKPGFAKALAKTIRELRGSDLNSDILTTIEPRGSDLAFLLAEYRTQLRSAKLADATDVFTIASGRVERSAVNLVSLPIVLLDIPLMSKAERKFVAALVGQAADVLATVADGDTRTIAAFQSLGSELSQTSARTSTSLDRLQNFLFSSTPESSYPEDGTVEFFSAPGEGRECIEIARRIQQASRAGTKFDQIAIALGSPQTYAALLESALERAGIPVHFARGTQRPDASGRAFLALLLCAEEGLSAKRFAEYLSLGQVPDLEQNGAPPQRREMWVAATDDTLPDVLPAEEVAAEPPLERVEENEPLVSGSLRAPWKWEELLVEAAVVGGRDRWERRLNGLMREIQLKIESITLDEPDSPQIAKLEQQLTNLAHLGSFALPILEVLATFPERAIWGKWLALLQRVAPMVLRRPEHVLAVLAELQPIANVGPVALNEVREALSTRLPQITVEPPQSRYGRVFVGAPEQLRGCSFSIVFVPGLAERIFPQKIREDPLLLDGDRERLASADPPLLMLSDRAAHERLRLRIAAGAAVQKVLFSYPRVEVALARHRVPSFYALDIRRTTLGNLPNVDEFERVAARSSGAELAWLAPEDPAVAIDDIEHDLAVLRPLLQARSPVRGAARYLMELSPELGRSLRTRWQRWQDRWGGADGICSAHEKTREQLSPHRLTARAYSPTSLQSFAVCPYKFLLSTIHRLAPREESIPLQMLDPLTKGQMYHAILARFLRRALAENLLPLGSTKLLQAQMVLDELVAATADEYHEQLAPAIERVWQNEIEMMRADLRSLLTQMTETADDFVPELIEFAFGLQMNGSRDPSSSSQPVRLDSGYLLHGIVDLIEANGSGRRRVTDHKTGKARVTEGSIVSGGEVLQPVLYSLAVESLLRNHVDEARLSYCTAAGGYINRNIAMDVLARKLAGDALRLIDSAIEKGFLPAAPKPDACKYCDFIEVCGPYEERRVRGKDPRPLNDLSQLRTMR